MVTQSVWKKLRPQEAKAFKELKQTGKRISPARDMGRIAKPAGKRISKTGKIYWESRKNRSDKIGSRL